MDIIFCRKRNRIIKNGEIADELGSKDEDAFETKHLAFKAGFVSLRDRLNSLNRQMNVSQNNRPHSSLKNESTQSNQFATLQELFASRQNMQCSSTSSSFHHQKRPKIPVMKLNKEDWNVKCWEDRLTAHKRRQSGQLRQLVSQPSPKAKSIKPLRQIEVFQGRIDDVASKLEKVRDGAPQDEKLYQLELNKAPGKMKNSHEWTDLLKNELEQGVHNPQKLRSDLLASYSDQRQVKSPLGRPIRRIFPDDSNEEFG